MTQSGDAGRKDAAALTGRRSFPLGRLRVGFLILVALGLISAMAGRWTASLFHLGFLWASVIGIAIAFAIGLMLSRLDRLSYFITAGLVALLVAYGFYDFSRGPIDLSVEWALILALVPAVLLTMAFWDFRKLIQDIRHWVGTRR